MRIPFVFLAMCATAMPRVMAAQTSSSVSVVGGSTTDERGVRSNSVTVSPGVTIAAGPNSAWWLGAQGTLLESNGWSAGVNAFMSSRERLRGGFAIGVEAGGSATVTSYDASFVSGQLTPTLDWTVSRLTLFGGGRAAIGVTSIGNDQASGPLGRFTPLESVTRTSAAPLYGARLRLDAGTRPYGATVWVRDDVMRVEAARITDRSVGATIVAGALSLTGNIASRRGAGEAFTFGNGGVVYALSDAVALHVAAGTYPADPLTGAASGRYTSAGLRLSFGGGPRALPQPDGVRPAADGFTRLSIRAKDAHRVELYGDWNEWKPVPAERAGNGVWYVDLRLEPGEYRYAFRVDDAEWRVPAGTVAVDDGFGGKSAYVSVRRTGPTTQDSR